MLGLKLNMLVKGGLNVSAFQEHIYGRKIVHTGPIGMYYLAFSRLDVVVLSNDQAPNMWQTMIGTPGHYMALLIHIHLYQPNMWSVSELMFIAIWGATARLFQSHSLLNTYECLVNKTWPDIETNAATRPIGSPLNTENYSIFQLWL